MWKCAVCKKIDVPDTGFRVFVNYEIVTIMEIKPKIKCPAFGSVHYQIRICDICLKKRNKNLEINL